MKIKKNDQIQIIAGKDRGKRGKVLRTIPKLNKIVVEGLNVIKKHNKAKKSGEKGQRIEIPAPLSVSNVMLICPNCSKITRIEYKVEGDNKSRICKKCKAQINAK
jgi:large subunit ribosomal protein L24